MALETGQSHEALYLLSGPIKAGSWHLVGDGIVFDACDVRWDVVLRKADNSEQPIVSFSHHYDPPAGSDKYVAVPFDGDAAGDKVDAVGNADSLLLRITVTAGTANEYLFIPNGDGSNTGGRIPSITAPQ